MPPHSQLTVAIGRPTWRKPASRWQFGGPKGKGCDKLLKQAKDEV